ncbi:hypothetical protein Anas_07606, partial [Armadillidium nasatum]
GTWSVVVRYFSGEKGTCLASSSTIRLVRLDEESSTPDSSEDESHGIERASPNTSSLHQFSISGLGAQALRRGMFFQPDPYVKLRILPGDINKFEPHHGQRKQTSQVEGSVNPSWKKQV